MKRILITGGSGLVGSRLSELLTQKGYEVAWLSRSKSNLKGYKNYQWDIDNGTMDDNAIAQSDAIVHLAGTNVGEGWWTRDKKKSILDSRVKSAALLAGKLSTLVHSVKTFISASAVGFYGNRQDALMSETDKPGAGFLAEVCIAWENCVQPIADLGIRTVINRTGVVLSTKGGALVQLEKPLAFGIGAYLGDGRQYYSWIHIDDLCGIYIKAIEDETVTGIYNGVAPTPVHNKELVETIEQALQRTSITAPTPAFVLRTLLGEMSSVVLDSTNVSAKKIIEAGYQFQFPDLLMALKDLHQRKI